MAKRKGVSPLIATVLVIGFTIVLAALTVTWGTKLFKETTEETGKIADFSTKCSTGFNVEYSAVIPGAGSINANDMSSLLPRSAPKLSPKSSQSKIPRLSAATSNSLIIKVTAKNMNENYIGGFFFIIKSKNGEVESFSTDADIEADTFAGIFGSSVVGELSGYGTKTYVLTPFTMLSSGDSWKSLEARPILLLDTGSLKVCENEMVVQIKA